MTRLRRGGAAAGRPTVRWRSCSTSPCSTSTAWSTAGHEPVVHAPAALAAARAAGMRLSFVTNNALRPPTRWPAVSGPPASTPSPGTSRPLPRPPRSLLAERLPAGGKVLVAGGEGLRQAVRERGLVPVARADEAPLAVVTGYDPELTYARLG